MEDQESKVNASEPAEDQEPVVTDQPEQAPVIVAEKKSKKHILAMILVLILVIAGAALAYLLLTKEETEPVATNNTSQEPVVVVEEEKRPVADNFYIANSYEKTIVVYDTEGNQVSSTTIPTELMIAGSSLGVNDNIQVVKSGERIFYMAGEDPNEPLGGEPLTNELFELVDGSPVQLYKAPDNQKITKWLAVNEGNEIVFKTSREKADKVYETDIELLNVASKKVEQLTDYAVEETSWSSILVYDEDNKEVYYFNSTAGDVTKISVGIENKELSTKMYKLSCGSENSFCSLEYPDFASINDKYFVWGYFSSTGQFGVNIVNAATGEVESEYVLPENYEQIGNVYWSPDSSKIGFDVQPYSSEGQEKVGREERFMELTVGENNPVKLFTDISPGIGDYEAWQNANVSLYGYSNSGMYALIRNENIYKIFNLENQTVISTVDATGGDSATYVRWLR